MFVLLHENRKDSIFLSVKTFLTQRKKKDKSKNKKFIRKVIAEHLMVETRDVQTIPALVQPSLSGQGLKKVRSREGGRDLNVSCPRL